MLMYCSVILVTEGSTVFECLKENKKCPPKNTYIFPPKRNINFWFYDSDLLHTERKKLHDTFGLFHYKCAKKITVKRNKFCTFYFANIISYKVATWMLFIKSFTNSQGYLSVAGAFFNHKYKC